MDFIKTNGKEYPIRFSLNTIRHFCKEKGLDLDEFNTLFTSFDDSKIEHLEGLGLFILMALKEGARKEQQEFSLTLDDVFDFIDEDDDFLNNALKVFADSQGKVKSPPGEG